MSKCQTHRNLQNVSLCIYAWRGRRRCFFFRENKVQYLKERKERPNHRLPPLRYCCLFTPPSIIRISEPGLVLNLWLFHDASPHLQYILLRWCMHDQYQCEMSIHVSVFGATFMHLVVCNYSMCTRPTVYTYQYCLLWLSIYWWCFDCVLFTHLHLLNLASKAPQKTNNPLNPYLFYMYVLLADILTCSFLWINRGGSKLAEANLPDKKGSLKVTPASSSLHFAHQQYWSIDR